MATAEDFELAALVLADAADDVAGGSRHLAEVRADRAIEGGRVADLFDTSLELGRANAERAVADLEALVRLCRWRSGVCTEHAWALGRWEQQMAVWRRARAAWERAQVDPTRVAPYPGPAPARPIPPYDWVDPR
jgi:hypothetical protein